LKGGFKGKESGTWKVEKGEIVMTAKETTNPKLKEVGEVTRIKVVSVDDSTLKIPAAVPGPGGPPLPKEIKELVVVLKKVK
jgi:hypothetical protein